MTTIWILVILFLAMLIGPIAGAGLYYKKRKGMILNINQSRVRDERYFAKSFSEKIENGLQSAHDGKIILSKEEPYLEINQDMALPETVKNLAIIKDSNITIPDNVHYFEKEIYAASNLKLIGSDLTARAVYSAKKMIIGSNVSIIRWADAKETLAVYDHCNLGASATAGRKLSIGIDCRFRRIYAPEVRIGQYPDNDIDPLNGRDRRILRLPIKHEVVNCRFVSKEMINDNGIVENTVISWSNVNVTEGVIIQGDVRSHKGVRLCEGAVVCGNIFAENDILLEKNSVVLGSIFSQGSIRVEEGTMIGQPGRICSVIARNHIDFAKNVFLFGYASCEAGGSIAAENEQAKSSEEHQYVYLDDVQKPVILAYENLYDFEHVDQQGYRHQSAVRRVTVPDGAVEIKQSMFFDCGGLEDAVLPASIQKIDDYAFADCRKLKTISNLADMHLNEIGISAFENCQMLKEISLPESLITLNSAAFAGCTNLQNVNISKQTMLTSIPDHCFRDCSSLSEIEIPQSVSYIGISAFENCRRLRKVVISELQKDQPGILQMIAEGQGASIQYYNV